jgi:hypothetical protein
LDPELPVPELEVLPELFPLEELEPTEGPDADPPQAHTNPNPSIRARRIGTASSKRCALPSNSDAFIGVQ